MAVIKLMRFSNSCMKSSVLFSQFFLREVSTMPIPNLAAISDTSLSTSVDKFHLMSFAFFLLDRAIKNCAPEEERVESPLFMDGGLAVYTRAVNFRSCT